MVLQYGFDWQRALRSIRKPEASKILLGEKQKEVRQLST